MSDWSWETTDPRRSGGAGDLAKLFKNEEPKQPGALAIGAPAAEATLMAREVIQNSWDAAAELQMARTDSNRSFPPFRLDFDFEELDGLKRQGLAIASDLTGLAAQAAEVRANGAIRSLGMPRTTALDHAHDPRQVLQVLKITESGTTGMYGAFESDQSKMFLALISLGYTAKAAGAGGSYGYGKAGLIAGSATRTVFAYTCFEPRTDDRLDGEPITRRLLGMTYWGQHSVGGISYTGFARLGTDMGGWVSPLVNDAADRLAQELGLLVRSSSDDSSLGTTFLLIDPVIEPDDLRNAIERNWWPAIQERRFTPIISDRRVGEDVRRLVPRPRQNPAVAPFVRAYELATMSQDNDVNHELRADLGELPPALGRKAVGVLGAVADLGGWSYANDQDDDEQTTVRQATLIALTRGPRMVVEYHQPWGTKNHPPFVRGVFVADEAIDDLLRQTEPKAHDAWVTKSSHLEEGVDDLAPRTADHVLKMIGRTTRKFQERLRPPLPDPGDVRLSVLADLFRNIAKGAGQGTQPPPPHGERDLVIRTSLRSEVVGSSIRATGWVSLRLADHYTQADRAIVRVRIVYRFLEDDRAGEICPLEFRSPVPIGDTDEEGYFLIELGRDLAVINFTSQPYSPDWSGRLIFKADIVQPLKQQAAS